MRLKSLMFTSIVVLVDSGFASAPGGPSFNSNREQLAESSREAGAALHSALSDAHMMLSYLELGELDPALDRREGALNKLDRAVELYARMIEEAPNQPLVIEPERDEEELAVDYLRRVLGGRELAFPETEKELANLAKLFVSDFRDAFSSRERLDGEIPEMLDYYRTLFRAEAFLLNVGVVCSTIWNMHESAR